MDVSPGVLTYKGSFTEPSTEYLTLTNTSDAPLAFKVKTTAPRLYCVRPNASIVAPGEAVKISIILQGFTQPLPQDYKCKDKFLIVSSPCGDLTDASKVADQWAELQKTYGKESAQRKLRVNFIIDEPQDESHIDDTTFNATHNTTVNNTVNGTVNGTQLGADDADASVANASINPTVADRTLQEDGEKELKESTSKINTLSEKLDMNEAVPQQTPQAVSGVSLPFAAILVILALLLGWYLF